jgi:hypothetical protein
LSTGNSGPPINVGLAPTVFLAMHSHSSTPIGCDVAHYPNDGQKTIVLLYCNTAWIVICNERIS